MSVSKVSVLNSAFSILIGWQGLPCVKIDEQKTLFWRYQDVGEDCLATIEGKSQPFFLHPANLTFSLAIYYFYKEYVTKQLGSYDGQVDDLLYYYTFMYNLIQNKYKSQNKKFKRIDNYIK